MTDVLTYEVRRVRGEEEMAAALALRHDVFCVEQGVPVYEELDGRDSEGVHLVAVSNGTLLATCRLLFVGPTVQFSRLAVRQSARRQGIATALLSLADEETRAGGARRVVPHGQPSPAPSTRPPATSRADGSSWRRASSTSPWRSTSRRQLG